MFFSLLCLYYEQQRNTSCFNTCVEAKKELLVCKARYIPWSTKGVCSNMLLMFLCKIMGQET